MEKEEPQPPVERYHDPPQSWNLRDAPEEKSCQRRRCQGKDEVKWREPSAGRRQRG
jgi:hypothetical protein